MYRIVGEYVEVGGDTYVGFTFFEAGAGRLRPAPTLTLTSAVAEFGGRPLLGEVLTATQEDNKGFAIRFGGLIDHTTVRATVATPVGEIGFAIEDLLRIETVSSGSCGGQLCFGEPCVTPNGYGTTQEHSHACAGFDGWNANCNGANMVPDAHGGQGWCGYVDIHDGRHKFLFPEGNAALIEIAASGQTPESPGVPAPYGATFTIHEEATDIRATHGHVRMFWGVRIGNAYHFQERTVWECTAGTLSACGEYDLTLTSSYNHDVYQNIYYEVVGGWYGYSGATSWCSYSDCTTVGGMGGAGWVGVLESIRVDFYEGIPTLPSPPPEEA